MKSFYGGLRQTTVGFITKKLKSKEKVDPSAIRLVDYFANDDMIHIKIPNINNFKVQPLENFDEEQLYDDDPE